MPTQTVELTRIVRQFWPSMKIDTHTPDAWHTILHDLPFDDVLRAVQHLARCRSGYIAPADIRRQVAATAGILAPSEAEALTQAAAVAGERGEGASQLHPSVLEAYRRMGGATGFDGPMTVIRPQWARVWADVIREHEDDLLGGDLGLAIRQRQAIEAPVERLAPGECKHRMPRGLEPIPATGLPRCPLCRRETAA